MNWARSPQFSAVALLMAAVLGLVVANSPASATVADAVAIHLGGGLLDLTLEHWVTDGLLAIFFFLAAIELKQEFVSGELNTVGRAVVPAAAAVGGVLAPALIYIALAGDPAERTGWPIPTATDIAFALGVLALTGRWLPPRVRALLLALAVLDDLIAIGIIAVFFTTDLVPLALLGAVVLVAAFWLVSRRTGRWVVPVLVILGAATWLLVTLSGIHPTIAGVALGLVLVSRRAASTRHALEPWSNAVVLPVFAFVATLVVIPDVTATPLGPVFVAIVVALPVGKLVGITAGALLAGRITRQPMPFGDIVVVAALGGIGFTVSLLMNELAFEHAPTHATEGTLGVLVASLIAILIGGGASFARSRRYAVRGPRPSSGR